MVNECAVADGDAPDRAGDQADGAGVGRAAAADRGVPGGSGAAGREDRPSADGEEYVFVWIFDGAITDKIKYGRRHSRDDYSVVV